MRRTWVRIHGLAAALLVLVGCHSPEPNPKPPLREEYVLPPGDDPRFSAPLAYPKETLNTIPKKDTNMNMPAGGPSRGPRMGGTPSGFGGY